MLVCFMSGNLFPRKKVDKQQMHSDVHSHDWALHLEKKKKKHKCKKGVGSLFKNAKKYAHCIYR